MTRILIVEDQGIVARDLKLCLESLGFTVPALTASAEEALELARAERPDLVLMDIRLKGEMDGIEAAGRIREDLHLPVVYLTAQVDRSTIERAKATGPFGYVLKPFDKRELHTTIEMALATHRLESELRESRERTRLIIENALDAVVSADADCAITDWNAQAEKMFGWTRDEVLGRPLDEVIVPQRYREPFRHGLEHFRLTGQGAVLNKRFEIAALRRGGEEFPVELSVTPIRTAGGYAFSAFLRDVTESRRAREALLASEQKYRTLVETTGTGFVILDDEGKLIDANSEYVRLTGHLTLADIRGRHVREWTADHDRQRLNQMLAQCLQTGQVRNMEVDCCEPAGGRTPVELNATRLDTPDGAWILGLCRDISERRRTAAALAQKAEELARSNADLDEFAYAASHDLKGPLGMVMRHAQRLERRCKELLDAQSLEHLDSIKNGVRLMDRLIRDLHTNSQVGRDTRLESVETRALVDEVAQVLAPQIEDAGVEFSTSALPTVVASRTDLLTVFQNLIQNAIKFREAGRPPRIDISANRRGEEWLFAVRDNGIGIDPAYSERIFKLFERLPGAADTEGTGIGLANCKKAVERRGGRIWVESQPGAGSTFYFTLPVLAESTGTSGSI